MHPATLIVFLVVACLFSLVSESKADSTWTVPAKEEHNKWKDRQAPKKEKKEKDKKEKK